MNLSDELEGTASDRVFQISELLELILHHLRDETLDLSSCTLVCKSWDAIATCLLFETLSIDPLLYARVLTDANGSTVCEPRHFSLKQSPRVTSNVRDLSFGVFRSDVRDASFQAFEDVIRLHAIPIEVVGDAVSTFPALRALHLGRLSLLSPSTLQQCFWQVGPSYVAPPLSSPSQVYLDAMTIEFDIVPATLKYARVAFPAILNLFSATRSINMAYTGRFIWPSTAPAHPSSPTSDNNHHRLAHSPRWFRYEPRSHELHWWTLPGPGQMFSTTLERLLVLDYAPHYANVHFMNDLLRIHALGVRHFACIVGKDVVNSSIGTHGTSTSLLCASAFSLSQSGHLISTNLKLDLSLCNQLRTVHWGIWLHPYITENNFVPQNTYIWQPLVGAALTVPPDTLHDIHIFLALHEDNFGLGPDFDLLSAMRALLSELDYDLLERVMDRHRSLQMIEISFLSPSIPSPTEAEKHIRTRLPSKLATVVRFSSKSEQEFHEAMAA